MSKSNESKLLVDNTTVSLEVRREMSVRALMQIDPEYEQFLEGLPEKKRDRIHRSLSHLRTGLHTIAPLTCLEPGALVTMADRTLKPISEISKGELVLDANGEQTFCVQAMNREYRGAMFRFKYGPGTGKRWTPWMTADHRILVNNEYTHAADIKLKQKLAMPVRKFEEISEQDSAEAVLLGYYLAEGCCSIDRVFDGENKGSTTTFVFHEKETSYIEEIRAACLVLGYNEPRVYPRRDSKAVAVNIAGKTLAQWLEASGGKYCYGKRLALAILNWPLEKQRRMLLAYVNGDGSWREARIGQRRTHCAEASWTTTSKVLAEQLYYISCNMGLNPSQVRLNKLKPGKLRSYYTYIAADAIERLKHAVNIESMLAVSAIETKYVSMQVYDIETGSHSFLLQGIVSHNCLGPSKCPFIEHCPIPDRGVNGELELGPLTDYPVYRNCVYEQLYMQQKVYDYIQHFQDVDPNNPVEMALLNDLAIIDLYKNRAMLIMSAGDRDGDGRDFMKQDVMEQQGEHALLRNTQTQLHPAAIYIDSLEKRRDRILTALLETRKSKAEMSAKLGNAKVDSAIREELVAVRKALEAAAAGTKSTKEDLPLYIDED